MYIVIALSRIWGTFEKIAELDKFVQYVMDSCSNPAAFTIVVVDDAGVKELRKLDIYAQECGISRRTTEERWEDDKK